MSELKKNNNMNVDVNVAKTKESISDDTNIDIAETQENIGDNANATITGTQENVSGDVNATITGTQESVKDKKKWKIFGFAGVIVAAFLIGIGWYNAPAQRIDRQLTLGYKYLEEQQYEEAVIAFSNAIVIDEKCLEAYAGGIEAYQNTDKTEEMQTFYDNALTVTRSLDANAVAQNEEYVNTLYLSADEVYGNDLEKTTKILEEGLVITGNNEEVKKELIDQYKELIQQYTKEEKYSDSLAVYDKLLELGENSQQVLNELKNCIIQNVEQLVQEKKFDEAKALVEKYKTNETNVDLNDLTVFIEEQEKIEAENTAFMQKVYDLMAGEDYSAMHGVDGSEEANAFVSRMMGENYIYIPGENTELSGMGAGVYKFGEDGYYFFYGNYVDGKRVGQGTSFSNRVDNGYSIFTGEWQNDAPNGFGKENIVDGILGGAGVTYNRTSEGNLKDGLWDGNVQCVMNVSWGTFDLSFVAVNGVPTEDKTEELCAMYTDYGYDAPIIDGYVFAFDGDPFGYRVWSYAKPGETLGTIGYGD